MKEDNTGKNIYDKLSVFCDENLLEQVSIICDEIPEPDTYANKKIVIKKIKELITLLKENKVDSKDYKFLNEDLAAYDKTCTIKNYFEKDDSLQQFLIEQYSRMSAGEEGLLSIHLDLNYEQLKKLSRGVYDKTGNIQFFISNETRVEGKIVSEVFETPKDTPIASVYVKKDKDGVVEKTLFLFGENVDKKKNVFVREVVIPFRYYTFISKVGKEFLVLSTEELGTGDYIITGVCTNLNDYTNVTDSKKILMKLPVIFCKNAENSITTFSNVEDFFVKVKNLGITKKNFFDYPFSFKYFDEEKREKRVAHGYYPEWFKWFVWSWLLHSEKGATNKYPLNVLMIGPRGSGKTHILNSLHAKLGETEPVWDGSDSKLKSLVPSFRTKVPKRGYLADCSRFCLLDEFLRVIVGNNVEYVEESLGSMNSLLEHQVRKYASCNGSVKVNMTSRVFSVTNPVRGVKDIKGLVEKYDESFLSRFLFFWQGDDMISMVNNNKDCFQDFTNDIGTDEFLCLIDYFQGVHAKFKLERLKEIFDGVKNLLSDELVNLYNSRYLHHAKCVLDGIVKARCLFEKDEGFVANKDDYDVFKLVWSSLFKSWITDRNFLLKLPVSERMFYLPEKSKYLLEYLFEHEGIKFSDLKKDVDLNTYDVVTFFEVLRGARLISEVGECLYSYRYNEEGEL